MTDSRVCNTGRSTIEKKSTTIDNTMELIDVFIFVVARMSRQKYSISKYESDLSDLGPRLRLGPRQRGLYLILRDLLVILYLSYQCQTLFQHNFITLQNLMLKFYIPKTWGQEGRKGKGGVVIKLLMDTFFPYLCYSYQIVDNVTLSPSFYYTYDFTTFLNNNK